MLGYEDRKESKEDIVFALMDLIVQWEQDRSRS